MASAISNPVLYYLSVSFFNNLCLSLSHTLHVGLFDYQLMSFYLILFFFLSIYLSICYQSISSSLSLSPFIFYFFFLISPSIHLATKSLAISHRPFLILLHSSLSASLGHISSTISSSLFASALDSKRAWRRQASCCRWRSTPVVIQSWRTYCASFLFFSLLHYNQIHV